MGEVGTPKNGKCRKHGCQTSLLTQACTSSHTMATCVYKAREAAETANVLVEVVTKSPSASGSRTPYIGEMGQILGPRHCT